MPPFRLAHLTPLCWLERLLQARAALFPAVPWGMPPLTLSRGLTVPALPSGRFLLGEVKVPERNIEWPAALLFRAALLCAERGCGNNGNSGDDATCPNDGHDENGRTYGCGGNCGSGTSSANCTNGTPCGNNGNSTNGGNCAYGGSSTSRGTPNYGRACRQFLAAGGLEAFVWQRGITVLRRVTLAGGVGTLLCCRC